MPPKSPVPMPSTIKINGYTWTVVCGGEAYYANVSEMIDNKDHVERGALLAGFTHRTAGLTIYIRPDLPPMVERETLLHEVMHAAYYVAGNPFGWMNLAPDDDEDREMSLEEQTIRFTSPLILSVLRDNPDLVAYLTQA